MLSDKRKSGIPLVGELPWGSHFCQFYQTTEDLLDILLPYFAAGVENNEFCVWITSEAPGHDDARRALGTAAHRLELSALKGKVEIIPSSRWHAGDGKTGSAFSLTLDRAIIGGFDGLRIAYAASPAKEAGRAFAQEIDAIRRYNALALFAYRRDEFDALGLMDVIKNHRFALVRNAGGWEVIESSEARIVRDELAKSEEKLQSLFNNMSEGFAYHRIVLDPAGKPCDYIFLEVNKAFEKLTGLRGKDIIGKRVTVALPGIEKDPSDWIGIYGNVALTGTPVQFESYAGPLGKWYLISAFCSHKGYFGVTFSDITARKQAEEKITNLNEELRKKIAELSTANVSMRESRRAALNLVEDAVAARRDTEKANTDLQRSVERFELLATTAGELLQATEPQKKVEALCRKVMAYLGCHAFFNFLVDEQAGRLRLNACAGIPEEEAKRIEWLDFGVAVCGCVARDGQRIVAERIPATPDKRTELIKSFGIKAYCCHPLLGPGGKIIGTLSFGTKNRETFSDDDLSLMKAVTDQVATAMTRKQAEDDILKLSELMAARNLELEALNKELEAFNYSISHDLRAPIRSMAGFSKIVTEDYAERLDDQGKDYLTRIQNASDKMTHLIDDLLNLSRISREPIDRMDIDLSKLADSVIHNMRETYAGRSVEVVVREGMRASVDPNLMRVVLTNLLDNAWKFTGKMENARIEFGSLEEDGETVYYIRDNGAGFGQEYAYKMFWPFHRLHTDKEFPGTGIGLAIVDRIIRRHGGRIWAEGELGKGATFYFTLGGV